MGTGDGQFGQVSTDAVLAIVADVLDREPAHLSTDAPLTTLGLESFIAVRLRRRLREELGADVPLTDFLGETTVVDLVASIRVGAAPLADADTLTLVDGPLADAGRTFALTPVQAAYLAGRDPAFPLGGVATFYYHEFDRTPPSVAECDLQTLQVAWNQLVRRHPMLRVVMTHTGMQHVLGEVPDYVFSVTDLRDLAPGNLEATLADLRYQCSHQLRPADRWPLFDLRAALLPEGTTRLFVGFDVLALDLKSWMQLMSEWGQVVANPDAELPIMTLTFADLVERRQSDGAEQQRRQTDAAYWARRITTLPGGPSLPWQQPLQALRSHRFIRHQATLPADTWAKLQQRTSETGLSPTGLLLAAFGLVLQRWGAEGGFCLNTTLFDRDDRAVGDDTPGVGSVVGDFTSTVLVEVPPVDLRSWSGFGSYAAGVNRQFWTDLDHRSVSGTEISGDRHRAIDPETKLPVPTHPVVFTSGIGLSPPGGSPAGWLGTEVFGVSQTPQVLLDHIVWDEGAELRIAWDCVEGSLPQGFVEGMLAAQVRLLTRLAVGADAWEDPTLGWDPGFFEDAPRPVGGFGGVGPLLDDPLWAAAEPHRPALLDATSAVSFDELGDRCCTTGRVLAGLGVGPGDLVGVVADKGVAQVAAILGVIASGAGYVPIEPAWPAARVTSVCAQAGLRHVVALGDGAVGDVEQDGWPVGVTVHRLGPDGTLAGDTSVEPAPAAADDLAYVIFTSGSTGHPKGVSIEHRAARTTLDDLALRFPLRPDDRILGLSAYSFDLSVYDIFSVLGAGGALVLPDAERQRDPGHWLELMEQHRVTLWNSAPALLEMLVEYADVDAELARRALASLRLVFLSADWIPVSLPDRLRALAPGAEVVSLGGATEASIWSICHPIGEVDPGWVSIPYGRALDGQSFLVLGGDGVPCPVGATGELHIGGDGLARGYIGNPAQTSERFIRHPVLHRRLYRTGDLGRWRTDGTIEFLGRLDRQVKIRGHRIELGEIEATLDRLSAVRQAVARSVPGPDDRPRLVCYVVPATPGEVDEDELIAALRAQLPPYMVPNRFIALTSLPVTENGKVDWKALPNPYRGHLDGAEPLRQVPGQAGQRGPAPPNAERGTTRACATPDPAPGPVLDASSSEQALLASLTDAAANGLEVWVTVGAGRLAPVDALQAAATCAGRLRAALTRAGVEPIERPCRKGLVELVLGASAPSSPATATMAPASAAPASAIHPPAGVAGPRPSRVGDGPGPRPEHEGPDPDPQVERAVARVFSDLLKGPVDVVTPYFRLGASSLTVVMAHRSLREELDAELTVVDLFANPTVRQTATLISERRARTRGARAPSGSAPPVPLPSSRAEARARAAELIR